MFDIIKKGDLSENLKEIKKNVTYNYCFDMFDLQRIKSLT
jgi:hypothetical protein